MCDASTQEIEKVRVVVRIRPLNKKELRNNETNVLTCNPKDHTIAITQSKPLKFDHVFTEYSPQTELYGSVAAPVVEKVFCGYNGTIFAYGQTGTGKTYTMLGDADAPELKGITPNTFEHIFNKITQLTGKEKTFVVAATYLEIYNEELRDLITEHPEKKLELREHKKYGVYVTNLSGYSIESVETLNKLLSKGNKLRATRTTEMNESSSRSHAIFTISIEAKNRATGATTFGKLNLVDLAGSERAHKSQTTGIGLRESCNINLSLLVLANVISALVDGKSSHIPYRNSKLTRLLQNGLGGNSKTAMIATVSPSERDAEESKSTLRYASRVKFIRNVTHSNVGLGYISAFEREIAQLKAQIAQLNLQESKVRLKRLKSNSKLAMEHREKLRANQELKNELTEKISVIQKKIIVGGENLYEKSCELMSLLESSEAEIEDLDRTNQELKETLIKKGTERLSVEEEYSSLQEEDLAVSEKIDQVVRLLNEAKISHANKEHDHQREIELLTDTKRQLATELEITRTVVDSFIPPKHLKLVESSIVFNHETRDFQIGNVAHSGNNMRIQGLVTNNYNLSPGSLKKAHAYKKYKKIRSRMSLAHLYSP